MDGPQAAESASLGPLLARRRRARGDPGVDQASQVATSAGAAAVAVRIWLRAHSPEDLLVHKLGRSGVPVGGISSEQAAALIGILRRRIPRDLAITAVKVVSNAVAATRRMGEAGAPWLLGCADGADCRAHYLRAESFARLPRGHSLNKSRAGQPLA